MIRQAVGWSAALTAAATCWAGVSWGIGTALALRALVAATAPTRAPRPGDVYGPSAAARLPAGTRIALCEDDGRRPDADAVVKECPVEMVRAGSAWVVVSAP